MRTRFDDLPDVEEREDADALDVSEVDIEPEELAAAEDTDEPVEPEDSDDAAVDEPERPSWFGRRKRLLALVAAVVVLAGSGGYYWYSTTVLPPGVAFRLGDHDVTVAELDHQVDTLRALYGVQAPAEPEKLDPFRRDVAKSYAVSMILDGAASDEKIVIADKMAQDTLGRFIEQQFGSGNDARDKFVQALGTVGTNEQAVLLEIKRQLAVNQLFERKSAGVTISDADVQAAFTQRKDQLATPERRDLHNIVVSSKSEADQVALDIANGTPFETIAQQRSLDGSTKAAGGALGVVSASQLDKVYADVAFTAPVNAIFGPVRTQFGWNVGKVVQVSPTTPAVFDQVKDTLKQQLLLEQQLGKWRDWLAAGIQGAGVDYADDFRPADPDAAPQGQPGTPEVAVQPAAK